MSEISNLFKNKEFLRINDNLIILKSHSDFTNQQQTNEVFSEKWVKWGNQSGYKEQNKFYNFQKNWYLKLYGFENEAQLSSFLNSKKIIFDAGCGLGYKAKWFADLAPSALVIGMDFSEAVYLAAKNYVHTKNLFFIRGDLADTFLKDNVIDYVSFDQVMMHTEEPEITLRELVRIIKPGGEIACNVYAKKALPRELLDTYFRKIVKDIKHEDLWEMSKQLTELGKKLSDLKIEIEVNDIPILGIKGGKYDLQRFIYWNFIKCFWNDDLGYDNSVMINFDWYAPSNAKTYSEVEFLEILKSNNLKTAYFHKEEACYSGRFKKNQK
jgi:ubiquinone/menaquinone biosynthesis C-methylase UbiE